MLDAAEAGRDAEGTSDVDGGNDDEDMLEEGEEREGAANGAVRATPSRQTHQIEGTGTITPFEEDDNISAASSAYLTSDHPYTEKATELAHQALADQKPQIRQSKDLDESKFISDFKMEKLSEWKELEHFFEEMPENDRMKWHFIHNITRKERASGLQFQAGTSASQALRTNATMPNPVDAMSRTPGQNDEGLKNLMMSWYWAGYYGGVYEGQKQASGPANS